MLGTFPQRFAQPTLRSSVGVTRGGSRFSAEASDYFARLDAAGLRVNAYDAANAAFIDRLVGNGGNFWPDSGAFCAMAGYLFPAEDPSIPPLYNQRMYFDGVDDIVRFGNVLNSVFAGADKKFCIESEIVVNSFVGSQFAILGKNGDTNTSTDNRQFTFRVLNDSKLEFVWFSTLDAGNVHSVRTTSTVSLGQKYKVKVEYDGSLDTNGGADRVKLYIDDVLQSSELSIDVGTLGDIRFGTAELAVGGLYDNSTTVQRSDGVIYNTKIWDTDSSAGTPVASWNGYGNTNADWTDQIGSNDGTVNGSPALFTGQGIPGSTLIPLHPNHDAGTIFAATSGAWNAATGMKGDGATIYVDSNRPNNADGQTNRCLGTYISELPSTGHVLGTSGSVRDSIYWNGSFLFGACSSKALGFIGSTKPLGLTSVSRDNASNYEFYWLGDSVTKNPTLGSALVNTTHVFRSSLGYSDARLPFYHIGPNLSGTGELAEMDAALTEWKNALANA